MRRQSNGVPATVTRILDTAERLVQHRGFNGFSYADVASELGLSKPALHYHFANKADLGSALVQRYAARFESALAALGDSDADPAAKLAGYAGLFLDVLRDQRMCLCGMLAAEYQTLPDPMRTTLVGFFSDNETWLARVLADGRADGSLDFAGTPLETARMVLDCLEGAMLLARPYADAARFEATTAHLLDSLRART